MKSCGIIFACVAMAGGAWAGTIDFDTSLPAGLTPNSSFIPGTGVDAAAQITNQFESVGALFSTTGGAGYAALVNLGAGHATSGANGVAPVASTNTISYGSVLDILLVVPGTLTPAVTDSISIRGDHDPSGGQVFFSAYDLLGNLIVSGQAQDTGGNTFSLSAAGIHEFRVQSGNADVAYDDLTFDVPVTQVTTSGTPEPATWGMMGLAAIAGLAIRRRAA